VAEEQTNVEPVSNQISLRDALFDDLSQDAERFQRQFGIVKRVVKLVTPSIVHIDAYRQTSPAPGHGSPETIDEAGSGIIIEIADAWYVLTNRHVVQAAELANIKIRTAAGEFLTGNQLWADSNTDVAVIALSDTGLPSARLADSGAVDIGDFVLAVGSPFGLSHSVSYGIISAKGRWDLALGSGDVRLQDFLQTDAAINPGNSGGPLLNLKGEVVGINTAIASNSGGNEGIGFSIPINLAMNVARQLVNRGEISTAYLGVKLDYLFSKRLAKDTRIATQLGLPRLGGAMVKGVTPGSPAAQARFEAGDVIVEFNGVRVEDDSHLVNLVSLTPLDRVVSVNLIRNKQPRLIQVKVGRRGDFEPRQ
jgi:serine protease Do